MNSSQIGFFIRNDRYLVTSDKRKLSGRMDRVMPRKPFIEQAVVDVRTRSNNTLKRNKTLEIPSRHSVMS